MRTPRKPKPIHQELQLVTPEQAQKWLDENNTQNRKLQESYAERLARDMENGKWEYTHEPIAFNCNGVLVDGQHRLRAIVLANMPMWMQVAYGSTSKGVDMGKSRKPHEQISLHGNLGEIGQNAVSTARTMYFGLKQRSTLTHAEIEDILNAHIDAIDFAHKHIGTSNKTPGVATAPTRAAVARAYYSVASECLADFCRVLRTGEFQGNGDKPMQLLWSWMHRSARSGPNDKATRRARYACTERAILAYVNNTKIKALRPTSAELFPLPGEAK